MPQSPSAPMRQHMGHRGFARPLHRAFTPDMHFGCPCARCLCMGVRSMLPVGRASTGANGGMHSCSRLGRSPGTLWPCDTHAERGGRGGRSDQIRSKLLLMADDPGTLRTAPRASLTLSLPWPATHAGGLWLRMAHHLRSRRHTHERIQRIFAEVLVQLLEDLVPPAHLRACMRLGGGGGVKCTRALVVHTRCAWHVRCFSSCTLACALQGGTGGSPHTIAAQTLHARLWCNFW